MPYPELRDGDTIGVKETPWIMPSAVFVDGVFHDYVTRAKLGPDGWAEKLDFDHVVRDEIPKKTIHGHVTYEKK